MAILQLDITENRPDGQAANERGELTDWQREWMIRQLKKPRPARILLLPHDTTIAGITSLIVTVFLTFVLGTVFKPADLFLVVSLLVGMLVFLRIAYHDNIGALQNRRYFSARLRPHLWNARQKLAKDHYQIESWDGPVRFVIYPPGAYWMAGIESVEDTYVIETPLHIFAVSKTLWEALRPHAENDFTLHYLTEPVPALLSVAHIPLSEPPTDAELSAVIGIGDDGELIYEEQNQQARSKA